MRKRYFLVTATYIDKIQVAKKQLIWLLKNTNIAEHLNILEVPKDECKGHYLNGYEIRQLRDS